MHHNRTELCTTTKSIVSTCRTTDMLPGDPKQRSHAALLVELCVLRDLWKP